MDDKINARAAERGISIGELTAETTAQFHEDIRALGVLMPEDVNEPGKPKRFIEPRATEHIPDMIALIERLIERGHAYAAEGHVLFDVPSDPNYGSLARRPVDEMRSGARIDVAPYKRDPLDFVLWKPSRKKGEAGAVIDEPGWDSPWGFGRPGWHIECSAMANRWLWDEPSLRGLLGEAGLAAPNVFDIHGGGVDIVFPHHENEVAQSTCGFGTPVMANTWMHNGMLLVEGKKMSKSDGNFVTIRDAVDGWGGKFWPTVVVRLAMLSGHYRQPIDWTSERLEQAAIALSTFGRFARSPEEVGPSEEFMSALADDLNTPLAVASLHRLVEQAKLGSYVAAQRLAASCNLLGLDVADFDIDHIKSSKQQRVERDLNYDRFNLLLASRAVAREAKNWAEADRIRDELAAMGITLKDAKDPETGEIVTTWEVTR